MAEPIITTKGTEMKPTESVEARDGRSQLDEQSPAAPAPATQTHYTNMISLLRRLNQYMGNIDDPTRRDVIKEHIQRATKERGLRCRKWNPRDCRAFVRKTRKEQAKRWIEYDEASLEYFSGKEWEADADHEARIQELVAERKAEEMVGFEGKSGVEK